MARLSREDILRLGPKLKRKEITLPEWEEGSLLIREFDGSMRKDVEGALMRVQENKTMPADLTERVACYAIIDDDGKPILDLKTDKEFMKSFSGKVLTDIFVAVLDLSGMSVESQRIAQEEMEKNRQNGDGSN